MTTLYYESSITHHGVKGQRWGVLRYQNPDGSLTPLGRKRYQKQMERISRKENRAQRKIAKENLRIQEQLKTAQAKQELEETKRLLNDTKKGNDTTYNKYKPKTPVSNLSDEEIVSIINRINLEQRYNSIVNPPNAKKDHSFIKDIAKNSFSNLMSGASKEVGKGLGKKLNTALFSVSTDDKGKKKDDDDD